MIVGAPFTAGDVAPAGGGSTRETRLCYYVAREAVVGQDGKRRGPVGCRITEELLVAVIDAARES